MESLEKHAVCYHYKSISFASRVSFLALSFFIDPLNRSFDPIKFDKHGIKGSIIVLITIAHNIHLIKFIPVWTNFDFDFDYDIL